MSSNDYRELHEWIESKINQLGTALAVHGLEQIAVELQDEFRWEFEQPDSDDEEADPAVITDDEDDDYQPEVIDLTGESDDEDVTMTPPRQIRRNPPSTPGAPIRVHNI